jgi:hypothetical protein
MSNKLVPLTIPTGWAVIHNSFGDEDPVVSDGSIINDEFYNEDLLSIEPIQFNGTNWVTDRNGYAFDLGWYPEADPEGCYRLILLRGDWNNIVVQFETKKRHEISQVIKQCFDLILQGINDKDMSSLLEIKKQDRKKKKLAKNNEVTKIGENDSENIPVKYPKEFESSNKYKGNYDYKYECPSKENKYKDNSKNKQSQPNYPLAG